jgi:hypothetical protein
LSDFSSFGISEQISLTRRSGRTYLSGEENATVQPCRDVRVEEIVWAQNAVLIEDFKYAPLVFNYDEAKNTTAWKTNRRMAVRRRSHHGKAIRYYAALWFRSLGPVSAPACAHGCTRNKAVYVRARMLR